MNSYYKERIPKWYLNNTQMDLVLSDDIDSLASCMLLNEIKEDWKIRYFYDFNNCYSSPKIQEDGEHERCWVDVAILEEKAFDNHVSRVDIFDKYNIDIINPNLLSGATNETYAMKYAGSTLLLLWSLYNRPLPTTEEGKMLLLCIDSAFKGHYSDRFTDTNKFYLCDVFGLDELHNVMKRHEISEFYNLINKYKLDSKIWIDENGNLNTDMDLEGIGNLLGLSLCLDENTTFDLWKELEVVEDKIPVWVTDTRQISKNIFTLAFTYQNAVRYSKIKQ